MTQKDLSKPASTPTRPSPCNILLIGETQAGKSTFVEAVQKYVNPDYSVDTTRLGTGNQSRTNTVIRVRVETNLPRYSVLERLDDKDGGRPQYQEINIDSIMDQEPNMDDYEDKINKRAGLVLTTANSEQRPLSRFVMFDTPGLNDTNQRDELHIATIFQSLKKLDSIHLVLVMVGPNPFTSGFQSALRCYMDVFPEFQGVIAFVHTKIDYKQLHPQKTDFQAGFEEKKALLHSIMGRSSCQHFVIDCDLQSTKPIRVCMTNNSIRRILALAPFNVPVAINKTSLHKTPKMVSMDKIIINKYEALVGSVVDTLASKDAGQGNMLKLVYELTTKVNKLLAEERSVAEFLARFDTDDLVMIHEDGFNEDWGLFRVTQERQMKFPREGVQEHVIHKVNLMHEATTILSTTGGEGCYNWRITFQRKSFRDGLLQAKLYTKSRDKYRYGISSRKTRAICLQAEIPVAREKMEEHNATYESEKQRIDVLVEQNRRFTGVLDLAHKDRLDPAAFETLAQEGVYAGRADENSVRVEQIYLAMVN